MTDTEIDRAVDDAKQASEDFLIREEKVFKNVTSLPNRREENSFENSEIDLASNLSSITELETD